MSALQPVHPCDFSDGVHGNKGAAQVVYPAQRLECENVSQKGNLSHGCEGQKERRIYGLDQNKSHTSQPDTSCVDSTSQCGMTSPTEYRPAAVSPLVESLDSASTPPPEVTAQSTARPPASVRHVSGAGGFSQVEAFEVELAYVAANHERLCAATKANFGHSGVTGLRRHRYNALHDRMAAENAAARQLKHQK